MGSLPSRNRCLLLLLALAGFCIRSSSSETALVGPTNTSAVKTLNTPTPVFPVLSSSVSGSIRVVQEISTLGTSFLSSTLRITSLPRPQMSPAVRITSSVFFGDPETETETETSDSVSAAVVGGVVIGLLVVVVVVIVIVIVAIVIVVRRKKSVYVLKPAQVPYFNNALYSEPTTDEDGAITVDTVDKSTVQYCSPLTLEESQLIATGILPRTYTKSYAELEPPHDYAEARLDGASLPQEYTYAASDHTDVAVPRSSLRSYLVQETPEQTTTVSDTRSRTSIPGPEILSSLVQENPAYGTAFSTGPALEKNLAYGAFEMTGHGNGQQPEYEMIVNQEYGASAVELMATTTIDEIDPEYSYPRVDTYWPLPLTDRAPDKD